MYASLLSALLLGAVPPQPSVSAPIAHAIPVAPPAGQVEVLQHLSASGVVIIDLGSGQQVFGRQATVRRPMASLTKLMTALIIVEQHDMLEQVQVPAAAAKTAGSTADLPVGEHFSVGELLSAMLIGSANDAAVTLALYHSGTQEAFVDAMNERAHALGLTSTQFANASGLDDDKQWSTPQDLAWLTSFIVQQSEIRSRMGKTAARITSTEGTELSILHTHQLVLNDDPRILGGKTGTTDAAEECLISVVEEGNREYIVVLLHSLQRYADMLRILADLS